MNSPRLDAAVQGLYTAFGAVPKPASIDACPCCEDRVEMCALLEGPSNRIPAPALSKYAFSVFYTAGSEADFKYLLPRICELMASPEWLTDLEVVLPKLRLARWHTWPQQQVDAVVRFLEAGFEDAVLSTDDAGRNVDSWLCGLARAQVDLNRFLRRLLEPDAAHALRGLHEKNAHELWSKGKLANTFWDDDAPGAQVLVAWLKSPEVQSRLT